MLPFFQLQRDILYMIINNPSYHSLRAFTREMPNAYLTDWDNFNIITRVKARSPQSTFIIGNNPSFLPNIDRRKYERFAQLQDSYLQKQYPFLTNPLTLLYSWDYSLE